ncbi:gene transfer agent family protein [Rhizobium rhizogenes]|uniref:gene transfer agent family protein n=1 Tax=Rhizobium rhizogenes TaxID=359 RepID=UPI0015732DBC|nr:gene transfer agent family protein [Rhizobium rhizogenes]NTI22375.1 gene transfer agent family protein [Rhizobium rhizogenes]QTG05961.1 gene transfer agent family protein [Rhizobium rhizogenes]
MIPWEGGEHPFKLGIGELRALQSATGVGPLFLMGRIVGSQWFVDDIIDTVRLGLIGGGMKPEDAKKLTDRVFTDNTPALYKHVLLATKVLRDSVMGEPDDPTGEDDQGEQLAGMNSGA